MKQVRAIIKTDGLQRPLKLVLFPL